MPTNIQTGKLGEQLALSYFTALHYEILHQNWRYAHWEIDLIASHQNILHFIEVKTRKSLLFGFPENLVTKKKMQNLLNASEAYLFKNPHWKRIQFDILSINLNQKNEPDFFLIEDISA